MLFGESNEEMHLGLDIHEHLINYWGHFYYNLSVTPLCPHLHSSDTYCLPILETAKQMHIKPCLLFLRETFSFVLTNVDGSRKIGYCRRLLVCATENCLLLPADCSAL
jgi:hypothetical protein